MDEKGVKLAAGCMLHDIGKVLYRYHDGRNHSVSGYEFLRDCGIDDSDILEQVHYHHASLLSKADIPVDSLAYVTYWADNVAAGADRKDKISSEDDRGGKRFEKYIPLASIFNILNGNQDTKTYALDTLHDDGRINMPSDGGKPIDEAVYGEIVSNIRDGLKASEFSGQYLNSLLGVLEANLTYVPSSTDTTQFQDISLYDHMKITAAVAGCTYLWMKENSEKDYRETLFRHAKQSYEEEMFMMYSLDTSGIQKYIYQVASDDVLKLLRAKSFYLEMLLQDVTDELLERIGLTRANLIYTGGGHAYLLLPNTKRCRELLQPFEAELKDWMLENFDTELYVSHGFTTCSGNELMNQPEGSYPEIFHRLAKNVSENKVHRYSAADLIRLNARVPEQSERECKVCGRTDHLMKLYEDDENENICPFCASLIRASADILQPNRFVTIVSAKPGCNAVPLPFGRYMLMETESSLRDRIQNDLHYVRSYSKNRMFTGMNMTTRIWIGDYNNGDTFQELASRSRGIRRLGVFRADVDNLGQAIINGFDRNDGKNLGSLTRNACLSRKLSIFFKLHINYILEHGAYHLEQDDSDTHELNGKARNALIVYSGGDDMFIVGAWNDVLEAAVDIQRQFREFTQHTLSISGGFSIFREKYPVGPMADSVGSMEDFSKQLEGKDAITLFEANGNRYRWSTFTDQVIGEKFRLLDQYFTKMPGKGMSAIYKLMSYVRAREEKINLARFAYLLGRMEPQRSHSGSTDEYKMLKEMHQQFARRMYDWIRSEDDSRQLLTAIYIYVYLHREERKNGNEQ